jgi:hypothetical protein
MTLDDFRREMEAYRQDVHKEGWDLKDSVHAWDRLEVLYRRFDAEERAIADQVISEWILSDNDSASHDGWVLARRCHIKSAIPAIEELVRRIASSRDPRVHGWLDTISRALEDIRRD